MREILSLPVLHIAVFYIVAVGLLCLHLSHGMRAMFQSVGWNWTFGGVPHLPNLLARWGALLFFLIYCGCLAAYDFLLLLDCCST